MSTNYVDTFVAISDDGPARTAVIPPDRPGSKTVARLQYELLSAQPYRYTSDDLLFEVFALRNDIADADRQTDRAAFFAKDQACLRASSLSKRYGWGTHHDATGRVALVAMESGRYLALTGDPSLTQLQALRSRRT